jgi:hypothetical protein
MPEYLFPGVYVEESDAGARPIPGVSTSIDSATLESLAADFRKAVQTRVPEWTGQNESDPGVSLVEVFAFLAEGLLFRANQIPERGRSAALRAAAALTALAALDRAAPSACGSLKRPLFFAGQLLDAATLTAEQDYHRQKLRLHNRALLGFGDVSGLGVRVESAESGGQGIAIEPGYAIDRNGEEIFLPCEAKLAVSASGESAFVTLRFWEHASSPAPAAGDVPSSMPCVEEACVLGIGSALVEPAIALARLLRSERGWRIDPAFETPRARHDP